ncbi:MAG: hypothetical protein HYZ49_18500 [Chloroflexi bacterium]|nr:hypothetical protein [Chloroflexota bacterium]
MTNLQLPDNLAKQIRETAEAIGITIPDLLRQLISDYRHKQNQALPARQQSNATSPITERLNAIYIKETSPLDMALFKMQTLSLGREQW